MAVEFKDSETKDNLMRAFAGESQARNRYNIAASQAKEQNLYVIAAVFNFTAEQEQEHASIFYNHLNTLGGESIHIDGTYPVDINQDVAKLLRFAQHNEYEEHDDVYKSFAEKAKEEGFLEVASSFEMISNIEKTHGDRFGMFADLLEQNKLFVSDVKTAWNAAIFTPVPKSLPFALSAITTEAILSDWNWHLTPEVTFRSDNPKQLSQVLLRQLFDF